MNGCTHFRCAGCDEIKLIEQKNVTKVAYSLYNGATQDEFRYRPYYTMLCNKCMKGGINDADNNIESK